MKRTMMFSLAVVILAAAAFATPGDTLKSIATPGSCPTGLAFDGKRLWLADRLSDSLYAVDPASGKTVEALPAPGYIPRGLAWDGKHLWCIDGEDNRIYCIDVKTGVTVKSLEAPATRPQGLAWDGEYLWMSDDREDKIAQISVEDGTTIVEFKSPSGSPQGLAWDGEYLWCADRIEDRIYMVETKYGEVLLSIDAPGLHARGLAWEGDNLWNADYQSDRLFQLVVMDEVQVKRAKPKNERLLFLHEFRNHGPDEVQTLDVYFALPHNRPNQEIIAEFKWEPAPTGFIEDRWGQKFAHFHIEDIPQGARMIESVVYQAKLYDARWFVFPEKVGSMKDIPKQIKQSYLADEDKYRINDQVILGAVKSAVGDEQNPYWIMRRVYKYVRDNMYYELAGGWNVAPAILERGNGSCSEYSFVFIAMCRAAGLPTRYVGSVAIRGDDASSDDVFHRWCECYLPGYGWVPVDPSGGDRESPAKAAEYFGHVHNRYLITTEGGGASEYLGWGYNAQEKWTSKGKVKAHIETVGEWSPLGEED